MMFRGREIAFTDIGRNLMERIKFELINEGIIDQEPKAGRTQYGDDSFTKKQ